VKARRKSASRQIKLIADEEEIAVSRKRTSDEELFGQQCRASGLPPAIPQLLFAKERLGRMWRLDWSFPDYRLAVEIDGVIVKRIGGQLVVLGGHASINDIRRNNDKGNAAIFLGWSVLHFLQTDVKSRKAIDGTMRELANRGWIKPSGGTNNASSSADTLPEVSG
jgi:hypothetical protein